MLTLYCYPGLFGLTDNNPFGLKVDAFMRLYGVEHTVKYALETKNAPRGQLPFIEDDKKIISDSNAIIDYVCQTNNINPYAGFSLVETTLTKTITSMLDNHLYWVMSYSRWQDDSFYPEFKAALMHQNPSVDGDTLDKAREYNLQRYHAQGIGRYPKEVVYEQGCHDLSIICNYLADKPYLLGEKATMVDTTCFGFLANIHYYPIKTPLKQFLDDSKTLSQYVVRIARQLNYLD